MTKVDFYILASSSPGEALQFSCRLAEKALTRGHTIYIHCRDERQAVDMDELLWKFSADSFVPHALKGTASEALLIGFDQQAPENPDLLINLNPEMPGFFSRFHRLAEIVCQDESWLQPSRQRYRFYKDRGYPLTTHNIS